MTAESMPGCRSVVLHEDDVAMTHGANSAFAELFACGSYSAGSVMVPCPWFPEAADLAVTNRQLDVGVHLTLTSEKRPYRWRPLTAPPRSAGITDEFGYFWAVVPPSAVALFQRPSKSNCELKSIQPSQLAST